MVQKFMRLDAVVDATGLSRSSIYRQIKAGKFPAPIKILGERVAVWPEKSIAEWQAQFVAQNDNGQGPKAA
jgi:prophage regulatory protein